MHRMLNRQLRRFLLDLESLPDLESWRRFVEFVDRALEQADQDRYLLERSLAVSSEEMLQLYDGLKKSSETAIANERDRLIAVMNNVADAIITMGESGQLQGFNPAAEKIFGYAKEELKTFHLDQLVNLEHPPIFHERIESIGIRKSGQQFPIELMLSQLKSNDQLLQIAVIRDITLRKENEKALLKAKETALQASEAKSQFLANMSHEIRTPLNGVIGLAELMRDTPLNAEQQEYLETIHQSGDMLLSIINDILDFSKIEVGKLELDMTSFSVQSCVEDVMELMATRGFEKQLDMAFIVNESVPEMIHGDLIRIRQILFNLLGNAVKFTKKGEVVGRVRAKREENGRLQLHFSIQDTGIGIPQDRLATLFAPFTQVDASITRKFGGTGLGLAISRQLITLMGGDMWVESREGVGSTFHFTILSDTVAASSNSVPKRLPLAGLEDKHFLVLEKHAATLELLQKSLKEWGVQKITCLHDLDAVAALGDGTRFDCVIIDSRIYKCESDLARLLSQPNLQNIRCILLQPKNTQYNCPDNWFVINRPVRPTLLLGAVQRCFPVSKQMHHAHPVPAIRKNRSKIADQYPLTILLVEDNLINQKVGLGMLKQLGYEADTAVNGLEAIKALAQEPYTVILMDVQMPELDGVSATKRIRQEWPEKNQPYIIALTANALKGDRERYLEAGMNDYLSKPVQLPALKSALLRCFQSIFTDSELPLTIS